MSPQGNSPHPYLIIRRSAYSQKKSTRGGKSTVVTYHCAQLEGEQTRRTPKEDDGNRRNRREKLKRYHCGGWLKITVVDENDLLVRIRISHAEAHPPFPGKAEKRAISEPLDEVRPADAVAVGQSASPIYEPAAAASASASVSGDDDGGDYWMPDEHNMNMPPQSNVYEEEEPRVRSFVYSAIVSYVDDRCLPGLLLPSATDCSSGSS